MVMLGKWRDFHGELWGENLVRNALSLENFEARIIMGKYKVWWECCGMGTIRKVALWRIFRFAWWQPETKESLRRNSFSNQNIDMILFWYDFWYYPDNFTQEEIPPVWTLKFNQEGFFICLDSVSVSEVDWLPLYMLFQGIPFMPWTFQQTLFFFRKIILVLFQYYVMI